MEKKQQSEKPSKKAAKILRNLSKKELDQVAGGYLCPTCGLLSGPGLPEILEQ